MTEPRVDYMALFQSVPMPVLVMTPDLVIIDMNLAYLQVTGRKREELLDRYVFDAFPDNPADPYATGVHNVRSSLRRVLFTGERDVMPLQKYDVEAPGRPGEFENRYWCPINAPVFGPGGEVAFLIQCVEEVTDRIHKFIGTQIAEADPVTGL